MHFGHPWLCQNMIKYAFLKRPQKNMHFEYAFWDFRYAFLTLVAVGLPKLISVETSCGEVLYREALWGSAAGTCCEEVLWRSVGKECCEGVL